MYCLAKSVTIIPYFTVHSLWDKIEPLLAKAVEYDDVNIMNAVYTDAINNNLQLWACIDDTKPDDIELIVGTRFIRGKHDIYLDITYVAGKNLKTWYDDFFPILEEFAIKNSCTACRFHGRVFLHKMMTERGWQTKKIITYKSLSNRELNLE